MLRVPARFAWSLLVVTMDRRGARGVSWLGVASSGVALVMGSGSRWMRGCAIIRSSTSMVGVLGDSWSDQSGLLGAFRAVCGDGEEGGVGVSLLGNDGIGRACWAGIPGCVLGVTRGKSWVSWRVASAGMEIVLNLGIGSYIDSMSIMSSLVPVWVRFSAFAGWGG